MGDTGLLVSHAFNEAGLDQNELYKEILQGRLSINNGMLFDNVIAQTLVSKEYKLYFYTHYSEEKHRNDIEIDLLISNRSKTNFKLIPIKVKYGRTYMTTSLERFLVRYKDRIDRSYVIHPKNLQIKENEIICIPAYMAFKL